MPPSVNRKLLIASILASLAFHILELHFLHRQSVWFSSSETSEPSMLEKTEILKEAFALGQGSKKIVPKEEPLLYSPPVHIPASPHFSRNLSLEQTSLPSLPSPEHLFSLSSIPKGMLIPGKQEKKQLIPETLSSTTSFPLTPISLSSQPPTIALSSSVLESGAIPRLCPTPATKIPAFAKIQTHSASFDTDLIVLEKEGGGYFFALTLIPKSDLTLQPLQQNYYFLIDRSNSIQKERLFATKNAVRKAIGELGPKDRFNIFVFDQKVEKMAPVPLPCTPETLAKAQIFLDKIELGSFFSHTDLYKPLVLTVPPGGKGEISTAILMTDGEGLSNDLLCQWTQVNQGNVALYSLGMQGDPHFDMLETLTGCNKGKAFFSPTHRGLKRKLLKLMKSLHTPIATQLSFTAIAKDGVELFPLSEQAPYLFLNEPYVILGTTTSLNDFVLFVQGKSNQEWLHVKKTISFSHAKQGTSSLKWEWAHQKAFALYQQYLDSQDPKYFAEAQKLLKVE